MNSLLHSMNPVVRGVLIGALVLVSIPINLAILAFGLRMTLGWSPW
jgi:hypothetical protein